MNILDIEKDKKIAILNVDSTIPNLALMKLSRWFKRIGCSVEIYNPGKIYNVIFKSKIFTFSRDIEISLINKYFDIRQEIIIGGTGYDYKISLPEEIENVFLIMIFSNVPMLLVLLLEDV